MRLALLDNGQIGQEHQGALNGPGELRIDLIYFGRASLFGLLVLDYLR